MTTTAFHHCRSAWAYQLLLFICDEVRKWTGIVCGRSIFKMRPDDKFDIEYDYNRPEGAEETGETIEVFLANSPRRSTRAWAIFRQASG